MPNMRCVTLYLYYFEELSLDEISKTVGLTANNVKVKLFRSRKKLTSIFKDSPGHLGRLAALLTLSLIGGGT